MPGADPDVSFGISLGAQLGATAALVIIMVLVHAGGILAATKFFRLRDDSLRSHQINVRAFGLLIMIALWLFALHVTEILIFALFYFHASTIDFEDALYFSISAYATLGQPEIALPDDWRLVGAFEGLIGFLLIGWSAAVFIADMSKLLRAPPIDEAGKEPERKA